MCNVQGAGKGARRGARSKGRREERSKGKSEERSEKQVAQEGAGSTKNK